MGDHSTRNRWALKDAPHPEYACRTWKHPPGPSQRLDDTSIRIKGQWKNLYCMVNRADQTVDLLLAILRDCHAAQRFMGKTVDLHDVPEKITLDKSDAPHGGGPASLSVMPSRRWQLR